MKYEIEINGKIPDEWEVDRIGLGRTGDSYLGPILSDGFFQINQVDHHSGSGTRVIVRRKVRKYDWSKTLDDVLVIADNGHIYPNDGIRPRGLYNGWQPNIHGKCPVDPEAVIVKVRFMDGDEDEGKASTFTWAHSFHPGTIVGWQFIRLAEGYKW